jgi:hypothetical protein
MALFPLSTPIVFAPCAAAKRVVPRRFTRNAQESARSPQIPEPGDTLFPIAQQNDRRAQLKRAGG